MIRTNTSGAIRWAEQRAYPYVFLDSFVYPTLPYPNQVFIFCTWQSGNGRVYPEYLLQVPSLFTATTRAKISPKETRNLH